MNEPTPQPITTFDSVPGTLRHISIVGDRIRDFNRVMSKRSRTHDASKLTGIERECLDAIGPQECTEVGSDLYKRRLEKLRPMIEHHMANNSHHPEHYPNGIDGMDLFDLVEMLCDWMAAAEERDPTGFDINKSIGYIRRKFNVSDQLESILVNTANNWPK